MKLLLHDSLIAWRTLMRRPVLTASAVIMLSLGATCCIFMFGLAHDLLLRPLPFPESEQLVTFYEQRDKQPQGRRVASLGAVEAWKRSFQDSVQLEHSRAWHPIIDEGDSLQSLTGAKVSPGFHRLLGVEPLLGCHFTEQDASPDADPVVILSHGFWKRSFGAEPGVLGSTLTLDDHGRPEIVTVIGVLKPDPEIRPPVVFEVAEIWSPLRPVKPLAGGGPRISRVIGRVADPTALARVRTRLELSDQELGRGDPNTYTGWESRAESLHELAVAPVRPALRALGVAVLLVFLVAFSNSTLLLMTDQSRRQQDSAIHLAMGAGPSNLTRQRFAESFWISGSATLFGFAIATLVAKSVSLTGLAGMPKVTELSWGFPVAAFASCLFVATALVTGGLRGLRGQPMRALRHRTPSPGRWRSHISRSLVLLETAWSLILLITAGLMIQSFQHLIQQDSGFEPTRVVTMRVQPPGSFQGHPMQTHHLYRKTMDWAGALPELQSVGWVNSLPLTPSSMSLAVRASQSQEDAIPMEFLGVSEGFFSSLEIALVDGEIDFRDLEHRVVINRKGAELLWPGADQSLIGRELSLNWGLSQPWRIVAVVEDVRHRGLDSEALPTIYLPFELAPHNSLYLVAKTRTPPETLATTLRQWSRSREHPLVLDQIQTLERVLERTLARPRDCTLVISAFAAISLLLAASGAYSVVSFSIFTRRLDSSIRLALGASPIDLVKSTVSTGLRDGFLGVLLGLAGSLLLSGTLSKILYGVSTIDLPTFAGASILVLGMVLAASYLPSRALTRVDPAIVMRNR